MHTQYTYIYIYTYGYTHTHLLIENMADRGAGPIGKQMGYCRSELFVKMCVLLLRGLKPKTCVSDIRKSVAC